MSHDKDIPDPLGEIDRIIEEYAVEEFDVELDYAEFELESLAHEQNVLKLLSERLPQYSYFLDASERSHMTTDDLFAQFSTLESDLKITPTHPAYLALQNVEAVIFYSGRIADGMTLDGGKRKIQTDILTDEGLLEPERVALFHVADELVNGRGVDMSDPRDILAALNEQKKSAEDDRIFAELCIQAKAFLDEEFTQLRVNLNDPLYMGLRSLAAVSVSSSIVRDTSPMDLVVADIKDLRLLGITRSELEYVIASVAERLTSAL